MPDELGPAMKTTRTRPRVSAMRPAILAMPASWNASATSDTSLRRSAAMASFNAPALRIPSRSSQSPACSNTANSFGYGVSGAMTSGWRWCGNWSMNPVGSACSAKWRTQRVDGTM